MALVQKGTPPEDQKELIENDEIIEANAVVNYSPVTQSVGVKIQTVELGYLDIIKVPRSFFGFGTAILCLNLWTYLDTTLAMKLEQDFKLDSKVVSLVYATQMIGFLPTSFLVPRVIKWTTEKMHQLFTLVIIIGFLIQALGTFMIGPSHIFSNYLPNHVATIITGLCLTGFGGAFTSIGCY